MAMMDYIQSPAKTILAEGFPLNLILEDASPQWLLFWENLKQSLRHLLDLFEQRKYM